MTETKKQKQEREQKEHDEAIALNEAINPYGIPEEVYTIAPKSN